MSPGRWPLTVMEAKLWSGSVTLSGSYRRGDVGDWTKFRKDGPSLPKHCGLLFHAETNVVPPFAVYWQVVNTGEEASSANGLRGRVFPAGSAGTGGLIQKEATLYTGMHWIECFIVKDGKCVARSGEFAVNIL